MSMKKAIIEKCYDCIYDPLVSGTKNQQVENCPCDDCSLYEYRPVTQKLKDARKAARINAMSDDELFAYEKRCKEARERLMKNFAAT